MVPLFGARRGSGTRDARSREYVLTGAPVITADSYVVLVDLVVRYDEVARPDGHGLDWDPTDEVAVDAVAVATLRVAGESEYRDEVVAERARLGDPVAKALAFAPVTAGFRCTLVSLEVRAHEPDAPSASEFRIVG